jgi:hypothetical protein
MQSYATYSKRTTSSLSLLSCPTLRDGSVAVEEFLPMTDAISGRTFSLLRIFITRRVSYYILHSVIPEKFRTPRQVKCA